MLKLDSKTKTRLLSWFSHGFFLLCVCFSIVPPVVVLLLAPVSSGEASFLFISFPPPEEAPPPRRGRCWPLLWLLRLPDDVDVCSCWSWSLSRDSFLSQTSTVTPAGQQETAFISLSLCLFMMLLRYSPIPEPITSPRGLNLLICEQVQYLRCVKDNLVKSNKMQGQISHTPVTIHSHLSTVRVSYQHTVHASGVKPGEKAGKRFGILLGTFSRTYLQI